MSFSNEAYWNLLRKYLKLAKRYEILLCRFIKVSQKEKEEEEENN
jgi:hypothetical protein